MKSTNTAYSFQATFLRFYHSDLFWAQINVFTFGISYIVIVLFLMVIKHLPILFIKYDDLTLHTGME